MNLRPATNADRDAITALIESVYHEYGERICITGADSDLVDLEAAYADGDFAVLDDGETIRGTVAILPKPGHPECCCLKRVYLHPDLRGDGWGQRLVDWACDTARAQGMTRMEFWTDTRFERAHAFYRKLGFKSTGEIRTMHDAWEPYQEYFFFRAL